MFGVPSQQLQHYRGDSTQASSVQLQQNLLTTTQPPIGKDTQLRGDANESNFFYNSDEDREVEEILQQSNRLMERCDKSSIDASLNNQLQQHNNVSNNYDEDERMRDLQRQKLELLSLQYPNQESTYHIMDDESNFIDQSAVNIGDLSRLKAQNSSSMSKNHSNKQQIIGEIPNQIFSQMTTDDFEQV